MKKRFALKNYEIDGSIDEIVEVAKWSWYQTCKIANYQCTIHVRTLGFQLNLIAYQRNPCL